MQSESVESRIISIERRLRVYRLSFVSCVAIAVVAFATGQAKEEQNRPVDQEFKRGIRIWDRDGKRHIHLGHVKGVDGRDTFGLFLVGADKRVRAAFVLDDDQTRLLVGANGQCSTEIRSTTTKSDIIMYDVNANPRVIMIADEDRNAFRMTRAKTEATVDLRVDDGGLIGLRVSEGKETPSLMVGGMGKELHSGFHIVDFEKKNIRGTLGILDGVMSLQLNDASSQNFAMIGVTAGGAQRLHMEDKASEASFTAGITSDGIVNLQVTDRNGKNVLKAP